MTANNTIAAIATPVGTAGIGVIRISGPSATEIASRIFETSGRQVADFPTHIAHHGTLLDPRTSESIDDVVLTVFRAPKSYTGEDVVELSCHGGIAVLRAALDAALQAGARLAEPGEFTRRAFLNGKMDLAQAEAVNDLIRSRTDESRRAAMRQLDGKLSEAVRAASERILGVMAAVEAAVDFPDDVDEPDREWVLAELRAVVSRLEDLIASFGRGRVYREGLRVVIAGRANVGKSSLLNALLRHARAIVTPVPGTTRDLIEESLEIRGIPVVAIDTAGIRSTDDPIERIGVELSTEAIHGADLILLVFDISEGIRQADVELLDQVTDRPVIAVLNKIDLLPEEARGQETKEYAGSLGRRLPVIGTCASSGQGVEELEDAIAELVASHGLSSESVVVTNARHREALMSALESLSQALATIEAHEPVDLLFVDLAAARASLGLITGDTVSEDLLDRVFSQFCIGK
jgi:tRNA modification GTPase